MPKRSEKRDAAATEYVARRQRGEKVNLREFAEELGVAYDLLRRWKAQDGWEQKIVRKRGGQPGNQNSKGKKNAKGNHGGAPEGNKNAEKDGAYSAIFFDALSEEEQKLVDATPTQAGEVMRHELQVLKLREKKILDAIARYEQEPEDTLHLTSLTDMREPVKGQDGKRQQMGMYQKETPHERVMKLQEALYKVQGRIATIATAMRQAEEFGQRLELEKQRLEIMRMRATGTVDVPDVDDDEAIYE